MNNDKLPKKDISDNEIFQKVVFWVTSVVVLILAGINTITAIWAFVAPYIYCKFSESDCSYSEKADNIYLYKNIMPFWLIMIIALIAIFKTREMFYKFTKNRLKLSPVFNSMSYMISVFVILFLVFVIGSEMEDSTSKHNDYKDILISSTLDIAELVDSDLEKGNNKIIKESFIDSSYKYGYMEFSIKNIGDRGYEHYYIDDVNFETKIIDDIDINYFENDDIIVPNIKTEYYQFVDSNGYLVAPTETVKYPILDSSNYVLYNISESMENERLRFNADFSIAESIINKNKNSSYIYKNKMNYCIVVSLYYKENPSTVERKKCIQDIYSKQSILNRGKVSLVENGESNFRELFFDMGEVEYPNAQIKISLLREPISSSGAYLSDNSNKKLVWSITNEELSKTIKYRDEKSNRFCLEGFHKANKRDFYHIIYDNRNPKMIVKDNVKEGRCPNLY